MQRRLRLRKRKDYRRAYRIGQSCANRQFVVYWCKHRSAKPFRCGVSTSKKLGNAVVRNGLRRRVKEIVRHMETEVAMGLDFVIIVRQGAVDMPYAQLNSSIRHVFKKAGILQTSVKSDDLLRLRQGNARA